MSSVEETNWTEILKTPEGIAKAISFEKPLVEFIAIYPPEDDGDDDGSGGSRTMNAVLKVMELDVYAVAMEGELLSRKR